MNLEEIFDCQILDQYYQRYNLLRKEKKSVLVCSTVRTLKRAIIMYYIPLKIKVNTRLLNIAAQKTQYFLQQWH